MTGWGASGKKELWDSSTEKAKELTLDMFGSPDEVLEMAKPIRTAKDRFEAKEILEKVIEKGLLTSRSGVTARLTKKTIGKIVSSDALSSSSSRDAHYFAAANLDKFFSNAIEPWKFELNPNKQNDGLKERKYLYAPMQYGDRIQTVKFTVKEYFDESLGNKMYSIATIDTDLGIKK